MKRYLVIVMKKLQRSGKIVAITATRTNQYQVVLDSFMHQYRGDSYSFVVKKVESGGNQVLQQIEGADNPYNKCHSAATPLAFCPACGRMHRIGEGNKGEMNDKDRKDVSDGKDARE